MEGGSEQATSSDDCQLLIALRKIMKKEVEVMVIRTVHEVIKPIMEDLIREVVKQEIESAQDKILMGGNRSFGNETSVPKERSLGLKFLDEVSCPVLTGKVINGKGGTPIRVALVDKITGQVIDCGPKSSSKVEILVLEANDDDNEDNWSREDFNNRIIREGDKKKPHFAKSNYIYLKKGIGTLCNTKLGHDSTWMKKRKCRLGARMENFGGIEVQEAWTESFFVSDRRGKLHKKNHPPSLNDPVWRLEKIGKDGAPRKRLERKKIFTVGDFLFVHYNDPESLKKIVGAGDKNWKVTLDHALEYIIDDKRMYLYYPLSEPKMGVVFDVVGQLKGAIHDSHYVPNNDLPEAEQDCARKLLQSAFEYRNNIISFEDENTFQNQNTIITFDDENAFLQRFPDTSSYINAPTNFGIPEDPHYCDLERINGYGHTEPGTSSQIVQSPIRPSGHPTNICHFGLPNMGQFYDPGLLVPNQSPSCLFSEMDYQLETFGNCDILGSLISAEKNTISESHRAESHSHQQSNARSIHLVGAVSIMLWMYRLKKRVASGGIHVQKRQRT